VQKRLRWAWSHPVELRHESASTRGPTPPADRLEANEKVRERCSASMSDAGRTMLRWDVHTTDHPPRVLWAASEQEARERAECAGHTVEAVRLAWPAARK
jgi:hypothetical protein